MFLQRHIQEEYELFSKDKQKLVCLGIVFYEKKSIYIVLFVHNRLFKNLALSP